MKVAEDEVQMGICDNVDEALQGMRKDTTVEPTPEEEMPFPDQPDESQFINIPDGIDFPVTVDSSDDDDEMPFS